MKSVLRSIKPYWLYLILTKRKTIEVAKNFPKSKDWGGIVELYCSKDMQSFKRIPEKDRAWMSNYVGKVACQFVCDCMTPLYNVCTDDWRLLHGGLHKIEKQLVGLACLTEGELHEYASGRYCFAWHISNLKIYDKPKALREFRAICKQKPCDRNCEFIDWERADNGTIFYECRYAGYIPIVRPPQSWCYVEGLQNDRK